ncbi:MAG: selenocysteine-specific translation elongation factor [Hyphomicrobiaceae bacterium]|nr:selenocysteine-specific translation elongation factor [Hyphomicrobiaceae bacterium]
MIVGTAGHIDHGKTLLVKALTGVDCDRLKEEKARGITIELGFAYASLPGGGTLGFVDVPGHERFVHTMLAGAASIDFVVLVVAADDGVMPQTREHLQILDLLGLDQGLVALNKADLVDAVRLAEAEGEIRAALAGTTLEGADILPVSAATGQGIDDLRERLVLEAQSRPSRSVRGAFRMPVDRSFTVAGAGTVVTGGLVAGSVKVGDTVVALPSGSEARVRAIHALGQPAETAQAGVRAALNLAGLERGAVKRGGWLVTPGQRAASQRFDATFRLLASEPRAIRTWTPVHVHVGTSALEARLVLLEGDTMVPGQRGLVQVVTNEALPVRGQDRFVVRDAGAERTIGGGAVVDPRAPQRFRRTASRLAQLAAMSEPDPLDALSGLLDLEPGIVDLTAFVTDRGLSESEAAEMVELIEPAEATIGASRYIAAPATIEGLAPAIEAAVGRFHEENPERPGMSEDRLRLALTPRPAKPVLRAVLAMLAPAGKLVAQGGLVRLASHASSLGAADQRLWDRLEALIGADARFRPPQVREIAEATGQPIATIRKLLKTMARLGVVVEVATDRFFLKPALVELGRIAQELASSSETRTFSAAEFRDRASSGRNVGIQILEHFDRRGLTLRQGDVRRVVKDPAVVFGER